MGAAKPQYAARADGSEFDMDPVHQTLFIPLYGKAWVSRRHILLDDPMAERIWAAEAFPIRGKAASKYLAYNMAMRACVFDAWTRKQLALCDHALVLHIGCGLDSRCVRVSRGAARWIDADLEPVIAVRRRYFSESDGYAMRALDASSERDLRALPAADTAVVILEGVSMYLSGEELARLLRTLSERYARVHVLMDVYTRRAARLSRRSNPVSRLGVTALHGVDDMQELLQGTRLRVVCEHAMTPPSLTDALPGVDRWVFKGLFLQRVYRMFYRLYELEGMP